MSHRFTLRHAFGALLPFALAFAAPALAQEAGEEEAAQAPAPDTAAEAAEPAETDIVVRSLRLRADEELPAEVSPSPGMGRASRNVAVDALRFTSCAGLPRPDLLRRILDGRPETGETEKALHQHIVRNSGCFKGMPQITWQRESPYYGACNPVVINHQQPVCRVHYDRGAIYEQVLREYAPDLRLSRSNTFDRATRDRFRAREEHRNSGRTSSADDYFFAAACMVQLRPEFALALLREEPGSDREARLRGMMIADGAPCIGGVPVERVRVDPPQFRAFVAEAVYAWAVAVRRTDSLVPPQANG